MRRALPLAVFAAALATGFLCSRAYPGSTLVLLIFSACLSMPLALAFCRPFSLSYFFFAVFVFLGMWPKLVAHLLFSFDFLEPTGSFARTGEAWDRALLFASWGGAGIAVARILHLWWKRFRMRKPRSEHSNVRGAPGWYPRLSRYLWCGFLLLLVGVCAANDRYAFYQIGVEPRLILPAQLNVLPAWLISIGMALGLAVLVKWEMALRPHRAVLLCVGVLMQAALTSISALSRSIFFLQAAPSLVVLASGLWRRGQRKRVFAISALSAAFLVIIAIGVTAYRYHVYPASLIAGITQSVDATTATEQGGTSDEQTLRSAREARDEEIRAHLWRETLRQVGVIFIGRWVGLEGMLAVSSYEKPGFDLLARALRENPRAGVAALYQVIAGADYKRHSDQGHYTFLTLPGVMAILSYSGSAACVAVGMLLVTALLLMIEDLLLAATRNEIFAAVGGVSLANVLAQLAFPYLAFVFVAQLLVAAGCVAVIERWR